MSYLPEVFDFRSLLEVICISTSKTNKFNHHFKLLYSQTREVHFRAAHSHMAEKWRVFYITQSNFSSWIINTPKIQRDLSLTHCLHPLLWPEDTGSLKRVKRGKVLLAWCRKGWYLPRTCSKEALYTHLPATYIILIHWVSHSKISFQVLNILWAFIF